MRRETTFFALLVAGLMTLALFLVSYQVQDLEKQLEGINKGITEDRQAIHVLEAEWSHLNDPERLKTLARRYLKYEPMGADKVAHPQSIPWRGSNVDAGGLVRPSLIETGARVAEGAQ